MRSVNDYDHGSQNGGEKSAVRGVGFCFQVIFLCEACSLWIVPASVVMDTYLDFPSLQPLTLCVLTSVGWGNCIRAHSDRAWHLLELLTLACPYKKKPKGTLVLTHSRYLAGICCERSPKSLHHCEPTQLYAALLTRWLM